MSASSRGGIVIGRFMPPHAGHQYLIRFAKAFTDDLTVFVCTLSHEPIPGELRFAWMSRLFPDVRTIHITEEIPTASRSAQGAHTVWAHAIRARLDHDPSYVFASEEYGRDLAVALEAQFVPVDPRREVFPISAGMIRENPLANWSFIPDEVRPYFARKVVVVHADDGLVVSLATEYETIFATDYARYISGLALDGPVLGSEEGAGAPSSEHAYAPAQLARAQAASEAALLTRVNRFLFTPTDPLLSLVRSGVDEDEREKIMSRLETEFPYLAPALVVCLGETPRGYREAAARRGWQVEQAASEDAARVVVRSRVDSWLTGHR